MRARKDLKLLLTVFAAVMLTLLTGVLGAPFVRALRKSRGLVAFWFLGLATTLFLFAVGASAAGVFLASVWLVIGAYSSLEARGWGWWRSGLSALTLGSVTAGAAFAALLARAGVTTWSGFVALVDEKMMLVLPADVAVKPEAEIVAQQAPSALVILFLLCLGTALIFEGRLFAWLGLPRERVASHLRPLEFRLPDPMIWIVLTGFLVTMVNFDSNALAALGANVVNVSVVLYFFQGLAVLEVLLNSLRAGALLRLAVYLILVGQLFFVLSAVGLIDYWVDFRRRIRGSGERVGNGSRYGGSV